MKFQEDLFIGGKSLITIILLTEKGDKMAGQIQLDLNNYVNNKITE